MTGKNEMTNPAANSPEAANPDEIVTLTIDRLAHGGEGVARDSQGRVVFVAGGLPGDEVEAKITARKKNFARAEVVGVVSPGDLRVESACPAAAQGAGCCDFATLDPAHELEVKAGILADQLQRVGKLTQLPTPELIELAPHRGWRTRVRLGVDAKGRAGLRRRGSHELVTDVACTQLAPGLVDGLVGEGARRFTPGAEVIVVLDSDGNRHVVETRRAPRGKRVERIEEVLEGSGTVVERAGGHEFRFPATAFWQAHTKAADAYVHLADTWLAGLEPTGGCAWDLYGGVGVFVPVLAEALQAPDGKPGRVVSVDYSPAATQNLQPSLEPYGPEVVSAKVEAAISQLPGPDAVILDPPRTGAGARVVADIAAAGPQRVIHVGCDPATFARDLRAWEDAGYGIDKLAVFNAFPGTHHMEAAALLVPRPRD